MTTYGSEVLLGTISCLADTTMRLDERVAMHRRQLDFLETITKRMREEHGCNPLPYFRVEQGWDEHREEVLKTTLDLRSIKYPNPISPGSARNALLRILYESDADWLVCMDDDHSLYEHYNGYELIWDLAATKLLECASKRYLIVPVPAYWEGFKGEVAKWGKAETHWFLKKSRIYGYLPFCAIPNLVKYGYKPIWFHENHNLSDVNSIPEDLCFTYDWIADGGRLLQCYMWAARSCGNMIHSSIFESDTQRLDKVKAIHERWAPKYLKEKFPRNPRLWTEEGFKKNRNPSLVESIPRTWKYQLKETDMPSAEEIRKHRRKNLN